MSDAAAQQPEPDEAFVISTFKTRQDNRPKRVTTTWAGLIKSLTRHLRLVDKHDAELWSPARFATGTVREQVNVVDVSVLAFDIDDGTDASTVEYWLGDRCYVITSSFSHTPEHPKLRIVMRLAEPIPLADFGETWRRANQHLLHGHVDPSTKDASRMFYQPSCPPSTEPVAVVHDGPVLDWRTLPLVPRPRPAPKHTPGVPSGASDLEKRARALLNKWDNDLASMGAGAGRHNRLLELARAAGGLVGSGLLDRATAEDVLCGAAASNGLVEDDGEASVQRTVRDGLDDGARLPWTPDDLPDSPTWNPMPRVGQATPAAAAAAAAGGTPAGGTTMADWPEPAPIDGPPAAPRLPLDCFPAALVEHAEDVAERMQCPIDYVVWTLMVTLATVIGRAVGIRPKRLDDWTERPALWVALIGDPSSMKTPGMNAGVRLLHALAHLLREQHRARVNAWKESCAAAKLADPRHPHLDPEPELQWLVADDATTEKLAELLQPQISRGLVLVRDEVSGLIRELERYRARAGDREFLIQAYSGGPKSQVRMSRSVFVPDLLLSIVGGIQPDVAREIFASGADDGLGERFLAIWPEVSATYRPIDRFPDKDKRDAFDVVAKRLYVADWPALLVTDEFSAVPYCRASHEAHQVFSEWHARTVLSTRGEDARYRHRFGRRVGKYPGVAARLTQVLHLFEAAAVDDAHEAKAHMKIVDSAVVERVVRLMDTYVLPMEERVYGAYAVAPEADKARRIARWIREDRPAQFTGRQVRRHHWAEFDDELAVAAALEWLCSRDWLREAEPVRRRGRPSDVFLVNPRLLA